MVENFQKLKVLFLEDNPDDVELELYELKRGGLEVTHDIARNRAEFLAKLADLDADIIIADYSLPDITGVEAIHICRERKIDVPVILITGMGNEQIAVDSLREGATDYILKKNITGFAARVGRALEIWADRKAVDTMAGEKQRLQQQLFQSQKMESVGRLAGGIAHDFNNMLTGIMGYAGLSLRTLPDESPLVKNLQAIIDVSKRASDLVKQLLLFSRKIPLELKTVNLNLLIRENVDFIKRVVEETVEIKFDLQENLPDIQSDEGQLTQVLMNFAVNARDAMQGKGVLEFKTRKVDWENEDAQGDSAGRDGEYICITVSDTGCGIEQDNITKIFDPFYTTKEVGKGTGLGLAIVYSIISGHGGWLDVESRAGIGTTFNIFLPIHPVKGSRESTAVVHSIVDMPIRVQEGHETILVVEDEDILRAYIKEMLQDLGYRVILSRDGQEAIEVYKAKGSEIDLVLSDMIMPQKSGLELFAELREINPGVRFVLTTGYCLEEIDGSTLKDMEAILMKPYSTEKLTALVRNIFDR